VISRLAKSTGIHYVKTVWNHRNSTSSKCYLLQEDGVKVKKPPKVTFVAGKEKDAIILNVPPVSNRSGAD
jgi:hypothetical protein